MPYITGLKVRSVFILYGTEAVSLNKSAIDKLDKCIKLAVKRFLMWKMAAVREYCDLPYIDDIIEKRRINFINNMLDYKFGACLFALWLNFTTII